MIAVDVDSRGNMMDGLPGEKETHNLQKTRHVIVMHIPTTRVIQSQ